MDEDDFGPLRRLLDEAETVLPMPNWLRMMMMMMMMMMMYSNPKDFAGKSQANNTNNITKTSFHNSAFYA